ncbi:hypothetical protein QBC45DRAFT_377305 [Copromyces sp. CBS 386.78]|nr:hypothetical protein QBC45DRAFT_377305 [Copromyces sp. CBS 386.78]
MNGEDESNKPEQAPLERFLPEVAKINSKCNMNDSTAMETRQISGVRVLFGPGMEVLEVTETTMTKFPSYHTECKRVNLYWDRQWSNHSIRSGDASSLLTIHSLFLCGGIQVRGKPVTTHYFPLGPGSGTLELLELPSSVTEEEIKRQIPQKLLVGAKWSTTTPKCKDSVVSTLLTALKQFGRIKDHDVETLPTMMRLTALFQNEEDARRAVEVLNQSPLPVNPQQKLTARLGYEMEINGPEEWVQKIPGHLLSSASVLRSIHHIKYSLSLDGKLRFSLRGETHEVLVEVMGWIRKLPVSDQIHERRPRSQGSTTTDKCCAICYDTTESPVITKCKHVYCGECFYNMVSSTFSIGSSKDRAVCQAPKRSNTSTALDKSICGCTLGLDELRELLKPSTYERLFIASFKSYVHRHPGKIKNCPTTNCDYIYFVREHYNQPNQHSDNPATAPHITCPHCLASICIRCQEGHAARGMTCLEFQDHLAQGAHSMARIKEEQGIKNCPTCSTFLVKDEGCNHVTCTVCDTHMCWKCLEVFTGDNAVDDVYRHLNAVHGRIDDYPPDEDYYRYDDEEENEDDDDDDDDDRWERLGYLQRVRALEFEVELLKQGAAELRERLERSEEQINRIIGNNAGAEWVDEGQGEEADIGQQEDDGDDGIRVTPEARRQGIWLERVALHENRQMNEPAQPHERRDGEGIDDIAPFLNFELAFESSAFCLGIFMAFILGVFMAVVYHHVRPAVRRIVVWFRDILWVLVILLLWIFVVICRLKKYDGQRRG